MKVQKITIELKCNCGQVIQLTRTKQASVSTRFKCPNEKCGQSHKIKMGVDLT